MKKKGNKIPETNNFQEEMKKVLPYVVTYADERRTMHEMDRLDVDLHDLLGFAFEIVDDPERELTPTYIKVLYTLVVDILEKLISASNYLYPDLSDSYRDMVEKDLERIKSITPSELK